MILNWLINPTRPFLNCFLLPSWHSVQSYRPHLEGREPIWGDDWSHNPFIRQPPDWGFLGFSPDVRQMPGDLYTAPRFISSSSSLATDVTDVTLGASGLWQGTRTGAGGTATPTESFFGRRLWPHGQQVMLRHLNIFFQIKFFKQRWKDFQLKIKINIFRLHRRPIQ